MLQRRVCMPLLLRRISWLAGLLLARGLRLLWWALAERLRLLLCNRGTLVSAGWRLMLMLRLMLRLLLLLGLAALLLLRAWSRLLLTLRLHCTSRYWCLC